MPRFIGANTPDFLALLFELLGLLGFVWWRDAEWSVVVVAILFGLAVCTKPTMASFALAIGIYLILCREWRTLLLYVTAGALTGGLLVSVSRFLDGPFIYAHLLPSRPYVPALSENALVVLLFLPTLGLALRWIMFAGAGRWRALLAVTWAVSHGLAAVLWGGDGVGENIQLEPTATDAVILALALGDARRWFSQGVLLRVLPVIWPLVIVQFGFGRVSNDLQKWHALSARLAEYRQAILLLREQPRPVLCEDLLLCFEAGRESAIDAYFVRDRVRMGRQSDAPLRALLREQRFGAVEIGAPDDRQLPVARERLRFTASFMQDLVQRYTPQLQTRAFSVLVPAFGPWRRNAPAPSSGQHQHDAGGP